MIDLAVVIPAYNPPVSLVDYVDELLDLDFAEIIVINDGSLPETKEIFSRLEEKQRVKVLSHSSNQGKGIGLKTAFQYLKSHEKHLGFITTDADGQLIAQDVKRVAERLLEGPEGIVFGIRNFKEESVPFRNRLGNEVSSKLVEKLLGSRFNDTQTGLRAFLWEHLDWAIEVEGKGFEYEMNVLGEIVLRQLSYAEFEIHTSYSEEEKEGSHYRPIRDSVRIGKAIINARKAQHDSKHKKRQ